MGLPEGGFMRDDESERYNRGVLLALFVAAIASVGIVVACFGWGTGTL